VSLAAAAGWPGRADGRGRRRERSGIEPRQKVINGVMREAAGRSVDQLAQQENRVLIGLLKLRAETGVNKASA